MPKRESLDDILGEVPGPTTTTEDFDPATLKKIIEMNPEMLGGRTPEEFIQEMRNRQSTVTKQKQERDAIKAKLEGSFMLPTDVDQLAVALEKKFGIEKKELEDEIKRLNERLNSLKPRYRDTFMDQLLQIDENLVSPKTGFVLKDRKAWLDQIGFTVELFIAHGRKRR